MNIEPAIASQSAPSQYHDNGRSAADGAATSGRVESISFAIGDEQYGVDIMAVREIKGWSAITHLPQAARLCARRAQSARRDGADHRSALPLRPGQRPRRRRCTS